MAGWHYLLANQFLPGISKDFLFGPYYFIGLDALSSFTNMKTKLWFF